MPRPCRGPWDQLAGVGSWGLRERRSGGAEKGDAPGWGSEPRTRQKRAGPRGLPRPKARTRPSPRRRSSLRLNLPASVFPTPPQSPRLSLPTYSATPTLALGPKGQERSRVPPRSSPHAELRRTHRSLLASARRCSCSVRTRTTPGPQGLGLLEPQQAPSSSRGCLVAMEAMGVETRPVSSHRRNSRLSFRTPGQRLCQPRVSRHPARTGLRRVQPHTGCPTTARGALGAV